MRPKLDHDIDFFHLGKMPTDAMARRIVDEYQEVSYAGQKARHCQSYFKSAAGIGDSNLLRFVSVITVRR